MTRVGGIVLCGGRSSRMGQAKAWLPFGEEFMLPRVVRILGEVVAPVVVVAAPGQDVPAMPSEVEIVRDAVEGRGPLQGLAAGLLALRGKVEAVYLSSCDVPLLRPAFVRRVIDTLGESAVAVPQAEGYHHPLAAVYRVESVLPAVQTLLAENRMRPVFLFDAVPTVVLPPQAFAEADPTLQSLRNLNTPEEYAAALASASKRA